MIYHVIALQPRTPFKSYPQVVTVRTTAFEAAATTGGSASEEAAPAGEASTAGTSEFVGQVCRPFFSKCLVLFLTPLRRINTFSPYIVKPSRNVDVRPSMMVFQFTSYVGFLGIEQIRPP